MLTEEQIRGVLKDTNHMVRNSMHGPFWPELEQACRAIESAATAPLLARIAELERELEEARKQMERQKDEWLSWEAKRRALEVDAGRWREWEQGRGLTVVVPTPTDDKPDRKVTIIYSPNPYPAYPAAVRKAIDAAIKEQT